MTNIIYPSHQQLWDFLPENKDKLTFIMPSDPSAPPHLMTPARFTAE